jgi:predicted oxidoreductase (fatty acid repression mutant protein)
VLFGEHHDKLWDITRECLRKVTPPENFPKTLEKLDSISSGYGTALFFEDEYVVEDLQQKYPLYKENFPIWSQQASGMLQFIIWAAFEAEGLGMSLQHYNPLIDPQVKKQWALPDGWKLVAEMPFGKPLSSALKKDFLPVEDRIMVFR